MTARMAELAWIPFHLDDLDADFARFYRCDWETLDGPRFMTRAQRVSAYGGVMTDLVMRQSKPAAPSAPTEDDTLPPLPPGAQYGDLSDMIEG